MFLDHPRASGLGGLFATHPPIESRIANLVKFAGGHDPGPIVEAPPAAPAPPPASQLPPAADGRCPSVGRRAAARPVGASRAS